MSLSCLEHNLRHLYAAVHCPQKKSDLIANWSGTHLYIRGVGFGGHFWSLIYALAPLLGFSKAKLTRVQIAVRHTQRLFLEAQQKATAAQVEYLAALKARSIGQMVPENCFHLARSELTKWQSATKQWNKFLKSRHGKQTVEWVNKQCLDQKPFYSPEQVKEITALNRFYKIIALEGKLQRPIPVDLLFKIASSQELTSIERKNFKHFVSKINKKTDRPIPIHLFEKVLRSLTEIFQSITNATSTNAHATKLANLYMAFFKGRCKLISQEDEKHIEWRKSLKAMQELNCNGRTLILGEQIGIKQGLKADHNLIFTVKNDESIVISVGINRALHDLKKEFSDQFSWGLEPVHYIDVEKDGKFAIVERLAIDIAAFSWKSDRRILLEEEEMLVEPIRNLIEWFIEQEKMPTNFDAKDIMYSKEGYLKFIKAHPQGIFEYNTLIRFVRQVAHGNRWIYHYLITPLTRHPYAAMYKALVHNALSTEGYSVANLLAAHKIHPHHVDVLEQARLLHLQVGELKKSCLLKLTAQHPGVDVTSLSDQITQIILFSYMNGKFIAFLPANVEQEVYARFKI